MTTHPEPGIRTDRAAADQETGLAPQDVEALVGEMDGLARGLFRLLAAALEATPASTATAGHGTGTTGLPVEEHPAGPVEQHTEPPAPVLRSVEMPTDVPAVAAVPPASVPLPEPVAETTSVPMPSIPMPDVPMPDVPMSSVPMPDVPAVSPARTSPALAAALLDEISFLDD
jgi:hypothetical protein